MGEGGHGPRSSPNLRSFRRLGPRPQGVILARFSPETLNSSLLPAGRAVGGEILEFLLGFPEASPLSGALPRSTRRLGRRPRGAVLSRCGLRKTRIFNGPGAAPSDARFLNFFSGRGRACLQVVGSPVVPLSSPSSRPGRILRRKK